MSEINSMLISLFLYIVLVLVLIAVFMIGKWVGNAEFEHKYIDLEWMTCPKCRFTFKIPANGTGEKPKCPVCEGKGLKIASEF